MDIRMLNINDFVSIFPVEWWFKISEKIYLWNSTATHDRTIRSRARLIWIIPPVSSANCYRSLQFLVLNFYYLNYDWNSWSLAREEKRVLKNVPLPFQIFSWIFSRWFFSFSDFFPPVSSMYTYTPFGALLASVDFNSNKTEISSFEILRLFSLLLPFPSAERTSLSTRFVCFMSSTWLGLLLCSRLLHAS